MLNVEREKIFSKAWGRDNVFAFSLANLLAILSASQAFAMLAPAPSDFISAICQRGPVAIPMGYSDRTDVTAIAQVTSGLLHGGQVSAVASTVGTEAVFPKARPEVVPMFVYDFSKVDTNFYFDAQTLSHIYFAVPGSDSPYTQGVLPADTLWERSMPKVLANGDLMSVNPAYVQQVIASMGLQSGWAP